MNNNSISMLPVKKCKECGKYFHPSNSHQKYCSDDHYRPCPVCSKPVLAVYLSDPARCCSGICKSALGKLNKIRKQSTEPNLSPECINYMKEDAQATIEAFNLMNSIKKKYVGESHDGWISGNIYAVSINTVGKEHVVSAVYDYSSERNVNLEYKFTNKKKISTMFKAAK